MSPPRPHHSIRVALPRGDLRAPLSDHLLAAGFIVPGYGEAVRSYRFEVEDRWGVQVRVFADKDIPIQVALGQYDVGIGSRTWIDELLVRYPRDSIVPLRRLDIPAPTLVFVGERGRTLADLASGGVVRVATEFPNLTQRSMTWMRMPNYRLFEVWEQAEAWPPEDAELAVCAPTAAAAADGLSVVGEVHRGGAWLIANKRSLERRDLSEALDPLLTIPCAGSEPGLVTPRPLAGVGPGWSKRTPGRRTFRVAVPDGHQQAGTVASLAAAGIRFEGYEANGRADRYPRSNMAGVTVKVMRPQDMPRAVAIGQFDLAITGRDWLEVFRATYPAAPVVELCNLARSDYRIGAVVAADLPAETIQDAVAYWRRENPLREIRVASEYVGLADQYARSRHLGRYRVIPISGASEGFVPEDADILVEGTETGESMRANRLRMIEVIMKSTNCAIGAAAHPPGRRGELRDELVERLQAAALPDSRR